MLRYLEIREFALIDHLNIEFQEGLNLLTGETGSGKSIIVDALSLLLGEKGYAEMIRTGAEKAIVTGLFDIEDDGYLRKYFDSFGVQFTPEETIIKRELAHSGKGKAFVNGQLVPIGVLKEIAEFLVDIHGQNEQQTLYHPDSQLNFLDAFAGTESLSDEVRRAYEDWQELVKQVDQLKKNEQERLRTIDLLSFQTKEIEAAQLKGAQEDEDLIRERAILSNVEKLAQLSAQAYGVLYENEDSAGAAIKQAMRTIDELQRIDPSRTSWQEQLKSARIAIEEVSFLLREYASRIEFNPLRLEQVVQRMAEIDRVKRKYGKTLEAVLSYHQQIKADLEGLNNADQNISMLEKAMFSSCAQYRKKSRELSEQRQRAAQILEKKVEKELDELAMKHCRFRVVFSNEAKPSATESDRPGEFETANGVDVIEFHMSTNPGEEPKPLTKIASGGEISRIMLALKSLKTVDRRGKTLVFDEVDAGIGGQTAHVLGQKLKRLSRQNQVVCVTHLPQIASYADSHFFIEKKIESHRTTTRVTRLGAKDRVHEIARMISGDHRTDSVLKHAAELIKNAKGSG
ncbi:MAG TPA: DNA repair protein RecN [Candidatus Hodarchaeales archaeon]|nr:DNA repair protein RecN [Candidatus Hodarchaeales archaeon]